MAVRIRRNSDPYYNPVNNRMYKREVTDGDIARELRKLQSGIKMASGGGK